MRKSLLPVLALLVGLAVGVVLSSSPSSTTRNKHDRREPREEPPAEAGQRIVAEPLERNKTLPPPINPAYTFDDLGHHYVITVTPDGVTVTRMH